jgi:hypothetical protein
MHNRIIHQQHFVHKRQRKLKEISIYKATIR